MAEAAPVYLSLKLAAKLFKKPLEALAPDELQRVRSVAAKQQVLEGLILHTPEAANVMVPETSVESSLGEIRQRYASEQEYRDDLEHHGLDPASLRQAIERDMIVEAVLEKVAARSAAISETEVEIYWLMHQERFRRPETRSLRHILITINETLPGNEREASRQKIDAIHARLSKEPGRFAEQALKHSECPTAMNGGLLGNVPRGQLYPELDAVAFELPAGGLSAVVESEMGYHVMLCEAIQAEHTAHLAEARQSIREHLEQQRRAMCQKAWINELRRQAVAAPA